MTVSAYDKKIYDGDGATTVLPFSFEHYASSEIEARLRVVATGVTSLLVDPTHYSIASTPSGGDPFTAGTVTTVATYASTHQVIISRASTQTQQTDLLEGGVFPSDAIEDQLDKHQMQIQELQEQVDRCLQFPISDAKALSAILEPSPDRDTRYLMFDSLGQPAVSSGEAAPTDATLSVFMLSIMQAASKASLQVLIGLLDENDLGSDSDLYPATQQSIKYFIETQAATMAGKTLTAPIISDPTIAGTTVIGNGATLTTPIITNPTINTGASGTAILDEDAMGTDSDTQLATQQSIKAYVDARQTGMAVQVVNTTLGTKVYDGAHTAIPYDDTIPQDNEGVQAFTRTVTPTSATNILRVDVTAVVSNSGTSVVTALFQDKIGTVADAVAVVWSIITATWPQVHTFTHYMVAGTTDLMTFEVRVGGNGTATTLNGIANAQKYGGKLSSSITITEIKV